MAPIKDIPISQLNQQKFERQILYITVKMLIIIFKMSKKIFLMDDLCIVYLIQLLAKPVPFTT
jgi:hypothetical protein